MESRPRPCPGTELPEGVCRVDFREEAITIETICQEEKEYRSDASKKKIAVWEVLTAAAITTAACGKNRESDKQDNGSVNAPEAAAIIQSRVQNYRDEGRR